MEQLTQLSIPVVDDVLCVALLSDGWQRAHIMSFSSDRQTCELKLVDKGGYAVIATSQLRQIRQDFLSLPFQAVECYLANIEPRKCQSPLLHVCQSTQSLLLLVLSTGTCTFTSRTPAVDGQEFSTEAYEALREMTFGKAVQCQPVAVAGNNVPYIHVISAGADGQVKRRFSLASLHCSVIYSYHDFSKSAVSRDEWLVIDQNFKICHIIMSELTGQSCVIEDCAATVTVTLRYRYL